MGNIPTKVLARITKGLDQFQPIIKSARARDINESNTVTIVTDILSDILGYDKYTEVTSEVAIRGSYCDLAIKVEGNLEFLIEVKAIGMELKESHTRQAVNYAANQGIEWGAQREPYKTSRELCSKPGHRVGYSYKRGHLENLSYRVR